MEAPQTARSAPPATTGVRAGVAGPRGVELPVSGLTCHNCVQAVQRALRAVPGVRTATVNLAEGRAVVEYDPEQTGLPAPRAGAQGGGGEYGSLMRKWWFGAAVGIFTMIMSYPWLVPGLRDWFPRESQRLWYVWAGMGVGSLAVILFSGNHFFMGAWQGLRHRSANMHTLIALGTGVAWVYSTIALLFPQIFPSREFADVYYDVTVVVIALVDLGLAMELRAKGRTSEGSP